MLFRRRQVYFRASILLTFFGLSVSLLFHITSKPNSITWTPTAHIETWTTTGNMESWAATENMETWTTTTTTNMETLTTVATTTNGTKIQPSIEEAAQSILEIFTCAEIRDDYLYLSAKIDNQPELNEFLKAMQLVPLILIDKNVLTSLLFEDSIDKYVVEMGDFFQFAVQEKNWKCLEAAIYGLEAKWLIEKAESAVAFKHKRRPKAKIIVNKLINKNGVDYQVLLPFSGQFLQTVDHAVAFVAIKELLQIALSDIKVFIPENPRIFLERFKRGKFIDCKGSVNSKTESRTVINKKSIEDLANIRDFFDQMGAMFYLECGTLLGWYRDCSLIEHTTDLDVSVPIEYFTESFNLSIFNTDLFRIWKQFGRVNDSLEYATFLGPFGRGEKMDIFFNYQAPNYTFYGGWGSDYLIMFKLPKRKNYCSGDLYGKLFSVPCNVEEWLSTAYGDDFMMKKAFKFEHENGTWAGPINVNIIDTYNVTKTFFKHPWDGP